MKKPFLQMYKYAIVGLLSIQIENANNVYFLERNLKNVTLRSNPLVYIQQYQTISISNPIMLILRKVSPNHIYKDLFLVIHFTVSH